ncbi:MAG: alpha-glucan family phosphorylase [Candidatus Cyclobacteriaceae bacterium M2_1C_046]
MKFKHPYKIAKEYSKPVAYFSMEFAIDQPLKIYSGGLGFLAGSHMRSAYELKQNMIGIGMLWKYGYYDQVRKPNNEMDVLFQEKNNNFLEETDILLEVYVNGHPVKVKVFYLPPKVFGSAPMFLLSTDHPENDHLAQTITHKLYDDNLATRIAQYTVLGIGGAKLLEKLEHKVDIYHLNEAHALPAAFYLYDKLGSKKEVQKKLVFTTHTPVAAGNEKNDVEFLHQMGFFHKLSVNEVDDLIGLEDGIFNHSLAALRLAKKANAVSQKHKDVACEMWRYYSNTAKIEGITNAQNHNYWTDPELEKHYEKKNKNLFIKRKTELKNELFKEVADQTGKIFDPEIFTIVWARRFAEYKRADLITRDRARFERLMNNEKYPIQMIWAGKPYPLDHGAVNTFNHLVQITKPLNNATILTGYELRLSDTLKKGCDVWLNNPRIPKEASGTSGMTASMNGAVNFSTYDGWIIEFAEHGKNSFVIPPVNQDLPLEDQDKQDLDNLFDILENEILPMYYENKDKWIQLTWKSWEDVNKDFVASRMADEYYRKLYAEKIATLA